MPPHLSFFPSPLWLSEERLRAAHTGFHADRVLGHHRQDRVAMRLLLPAQAAGRGMPAICFDSLSRLPAHGSPGKRAVSSVRNSIHTKRPFWRNKFFEKAAYLLKGRIRVSKKPYLFYRPGREAERRPALAHHRHQKQPLIFFDIIQIEMMQRWFKNKY